MNEEIWKKIDWIPDLRGTYEASNLGRVRRTSLIWYDRHLKDYKNIHKIRELTPYDNGHGYLHVTLYVNTQYGVKQKVFYIHRLVAEGFIDNPDNKPEINHKNFIRKDNRATNLEWCSALENMAHSKSMDRRLKPYYPSKNSKRNDNEFEARHRRNKGKYKQ